MQFNTYGGTGAFLAADLVNATDHAPAALSAVLFKNEMKNHRVDAEQAERLVAWTARLRPVFGETAPERQIETVNALLNDAATCVQVSMHDGRAPHLHYVSDTSDPVERVRAATAGGLAVAICGAGGHRLGRCARTGCATVYVDTSRGGRRRFCSVACANRVNVAAHRARGR
ncbi:putative RNA-binding Zn ribbon-like protein [Spinactinospora alkalitolerans]|uniref:Putative RNA-binding Zn ribbon-like protein n=1 Tax=Spinactinospora alkalitolerans TaxID=687207 RepID=A0A852U034_9ACTN|nr:CGNR zinc finger domain-containing protein [Spinactinospora alkalitolerans]NYE48915.1 putative RNA-binding Zn ribbon-like protein [Spinactinospora alkalitolerans]